MAAISKINKRKCWQYLHIWQAGGKKHNFQ